MRSDLYLSTSDHHGWLGLCVSGSWSLSLYPISNVIYYSPLEVITDFILFHMAWAAILALRRSSRHMCEVVDSYMLLEHARRRRLLYLPFFDDDEQRLFLQEQANTGAIVSGSTALQLFNRAFYSGSDLDVYVTYETSIPMLSLLMRMGYRTISPSTTPATTQPAHLSIPAIETLAHGILWASLFCGRGDYKMEGLCIYAVVNLERGEAIVQLIVTRGQPMEAILNFSASTLLSLTFLVEA